MFDNLSERLGKTIKNLRGQGRLTESNIKDALREVRMSLIEADVALPVIKSFIDDIKQKSLGEEVQASLNPGQAMIKIVNDELIRVMGSECSELNLNAQAPAVILMAGLQGSGKTTTTAKLAKLLKEQHSKKVLVASADVYRPAAIKQLERLAQEIDVLFFPSDAQQKPMDIARNAIASAKQQLADVIILDTAGRLHVDDEMMSEIKQLHQEVKPTETLFVVDSMTGQDAAITAKAFDEALPLTGVILTKTDGDARGGAALSIRNITGKPIKFIGIGEKIDGLEAFHPDRIASRILGMGDILSLVEEVERKVDKKKSEKLAKKLRKGKNFDLNDFKEQIQQINNMGGLGSMMGKIPGMNQLPAQAMGQVNDGAMGKIVAIINSMTPKERRVPKIISGSRKKRIAMGSGTQIQDINKLLKQFNQMQKMMKKFSKPGAMKKMMRGLGGMGGMGGLGGMLPGDLPDDFK
jgi:signal recognition particle subunit SRP54